MFIIINEVEKALSISKHIGYMNIFPEGTVQEHKQLNIL